MVRTAFSFDDDKQLVQLARAYENAGSRICWNDVAHSMRGTGHTPAALKQRLRSLMRTHANRVSGFPANFFSPVHRSRGRPPAIVRQLHALRAVPRLPRRAPCTAPDRRTATTSGEVVPHRQPRPWRFSHRCQSKPRSRQTPLTEPTSRSRESLHSSP
ncbi:hypothetical protein JG688_00014894, partial [Phytophthora aleatoria]